MNLIIFSKSNYTKKQRQYSKDLANCRNFTDNSFESITSRDFQVSKLVKELELSALLEVRPESVPKILNGLKNQRETFSRGGDR